MPSLHALGVGTPWPELLVALLQPTLLQQIEASDPDTARVVRRRDASAFARLLHEWQDPPDGFDAAEPPAEWGADDYDDASEYDASEFEDFVDSDEEASEEETGVDEEEAADPEAVLDRILEGVCRPFKVRLEQALNASPTALVAYQLANLLDF